MTNEAYDNSTTLDPRIAERLKRDDWSRSRQEYWRKGDTSGHAQYVKSFALDCDGDAILIEVDQVGAACHTGKRSCFEEGGQLPVVVGYRTKEQEDQR